MISLFLDDEETRFQLLVTDPLNWIWAKTVEEAKQIVSKSKILNMSLDHDLGACPVCLDGKTYEQWLVEHNFQSMPNCEHFGTGYTFVCWMEEHDNWPVNKPRVHSRNPAGRLKMEMAINRKYGR